MQTIKMKNAGMSADERNRLRELARKCAEIARLPETEEKVKAWTAHNKGEGYRPMVVVELNNLDEVEDVPLVCNDPVAKQTEQKLLSYITAHNIGDDTVTPPDMPVPVNVAVLSFNTKKTIVHASTGSDSRIVPFITNLTKDIETLPSMTYSYDAERLKQRAERVGEAVGDILPVRLYNPNRMFVPFRWIVEAMGMEYMYLAMAEEQDAFHRMMEQIEQDIYGYLRWLEENKLLFLNNNSDYVASGGYGFTDELPRREIGGDLVRSTDIWGHLSAQECVGVSPGMYREFVYPYYKRIADQFGLLYYGCCESVATFWDSIRDFPNLRKVSVSPWCEEAPVGEFLAGSNIIYSRKPSPNCLINQKDFLYDEYVGYIKKTAGLTRQCKAEYILLDTYIMNSNTKKMKQAVEIIRKYAAYD